ncbi:hypothetical protein WDW37_01110 [Bdellovibrionota bacterium FG-1]
MRNLIVGLSIGLSLGLAGCLGKPDTVQAPNADTAAAQGALAISAGEGGAAGAQGGGAGAAAGDAVAVEGKIITISGFHPPGVSGINLDLVGANQASTVLFNALSLASAQKRLDPQLGDKTEVHLVVLRSSASAEITHVFKFSDFKSLMNSQLPLGVAYVSAEGEAVQVVGLPVGLPVMLGVPNLNGISASVTNSGGLVIFGGMNPQTKAPLSDLMVFDKKGAAIKPTPIALNMGSSVVALSVIHSQKPCPLMEGWTVVQIKDRVGGFSYKAYDLSSPVVPTKNISVTLSLLKSGGICTHF